MASEPRTFVYKTVAGCDVRADVYAASPGVQKPALVYIHGGALIMGTRKQIPPKQLVRYLDAGFAVVSIDYRLAPETKLPSIIDDIRDAFRWVARDGPSLLGINPGRIGVAGYSAGGYLTLMTGFAVAPRPKALVSFYGYGDIVGDWYAKPDPFYSKEPAVSREAALAVVGAKPTSESDESRHVFYLYCRQRGLWPKEVAGFDPATEAGEFKPFCPIQNVSPEYPPTLLLHGNLDTDVPYEQSLMMSDVLSRAGVENELVTIDGGPHGFDFAEDEPRTVSAVDRVVSFLKSRV